MPVGTIRDYLVHAGLCRWSEAILFGNWHVILVNGLRAGSVDRVRSGKVSTALARHGRYQTGRRQRC